MSKTSLINRPTHIVFEEEEEQPNGRQLTSAEIAALCPSKTKLVAKGLHVSRIDNLKFFLSLRGIDVSNNLLSDLSFLKENVDVVWLNLSSNQLTHLEYLENLQNLEVLNVSHNQLSNLIGIEHCKQLRALVANDNKITSLDNIVNLFNLNSLILSKNYLQDITSVRSIVTLKKLSCSHNQLRRIPDLSRLVQLTELRLNDNLIDSLPSTLASNRNLKVLDLGHNRIRSRKDLTVLSSLPCLKVLNLVGNPVVLEEDFQQNIISLCPYLEQLNGKVLVDKKRKRKHTFRSHFHANRVSDDDDDSQSKMVADQHMAEEPKETLPANDSQPENTGMSTHKDDSGCVSVKVKKPVSIQIGNPGKFSKSQAVPHIEEILTFGNGDGNKWL